MNSAKKKSQSIDAAGFKTFSKTVGNLVLTTGLKT